MNKRRKGISLIVLVITILVMIILAGVVIVSLQKNNPIEKAKEARFKQDMISFADEYSMYLTNKIAEDSNFNSRTLYASENSMIYANKPNTAYEKTIFDIIPTLKSSKYKTNLEIMQGELFYKGNNKKEAKWLQEIGMKINNIDLADILIQNGVLVYVNPNISADGTLIIPEGVTSINSAAFYGCSNLSSVVIPESVKELPERVFAECTNLQEVTLPTELREIKEESFINCKALKKINIPNKVTLIGKRAFENCISLTSVLGAQKLQTIGHRAFFGCYSLNEFNFEENLTNIESLAFYNCKFTNLDFPNSLTTIGESAFSSCNKLVSINIGKNVTSIGFGVYKGCSNLTTVNIDSMNPKYEVLDGNLYLKENLNENVDKTFMQALPSATKVEIESGTKIIATDAFNSCSKLQEVILPEGLEKIRSRAFIFLNNLQKVNIPSTVTSIAQENFIACPVKLEMPKEPLENKSYKVVDNVLYTYDMTKLIAMPENIKNYVMPDSVTEIGPFSMAYNKSMETFTCSKNLEVLGVYSCYNMKALKNITIPGKVKKISAISFGYCHALENIVIEEGVEEIHGSAFAHTDNLKSVILPTTLVNVVGNLFSNTNSNVKVEIRKNGQNPNPNIIMLSKDVIGTATSPKKALAIIDREGKVNIPNGVEVLGVNCLKDSAKITSLNLPNTLQKIENTVFENSTSITSLTIPSSVNEIEPRAFAGATKLLNIKIDKPKGSIAGEPWGLPAGSKVIKWN